MWPEPLFKNTNLLLCMQVTGHSEEDPNRPSCTDARCQKIKSFLKAHYFVESPYGTGPDDGCRIISPKTMKADIDENSRTVVLRKLPFQKTYVDGMKATTGWSILDLIDVDGDGYADVVIRADAYESHWLEVDSFLDGSAETIFSGLGYYL